MITEEDFLKLEGHVSSLTALLSGRQESKIDGEQIQRFIDNYAFISTVVEGSSIEAFIHNIASMQSRFDLVSAKLDGLISASEEEANKLIAGLGSGSAGIALSVADMSLFQASIGDSNKEVLEHLMEIDITGKLSVMESKIAEAAGVIQGLKEQKEKIEVLFDKIAQNKALIDNMDAVNKEQDSLIVSTQTLLVEVEKQIENYAFYSEEFDKVYVTAVHFVQKFSELLTRLNKLEERDNKLIELLNKTAGLSVDSFTSFETLVGGLSQAITQHGLDTAKQLQDILKYTEEAQGIALSFKGCRESFSSVAVKNNEAIDLLESATIGISE